MLSSRQTAEYKPYQAGDSRNLIAACLTWLLLLALLAPGHMSNDSFSHLAQGRSGVFSDMQPLAISVLFGALDAVYPGPLLLLALNLALVVFPTFGLLFRFTGSARATALTAIGVICFPVYLWQLGAIWRDITGLGVLLLSFYLLMIASDTTEASKTRLLAAFGVLLATLCGLLLRENAAAGSLPVIAALVFVFLPWPPKYAKRFAAVLIAAVALTLGTVAAGSFNRALSEQRSYVGQVYLNHLLGMTSLAVTKNLFPSDAYPELTIDHIERVVQQSGDPSIFLRHLWFSYTRGVDPMFPRLDEVTYGLLKDAVIRSLWSHPREMLLAKARTMTFVAIRAPVWGHAPCDTGPNPIPAAHVDSSHLDRPDLIIRLCWRTTDLALKWFPLRPLPYIIATIIFLVAVWLWKRESVALEALLVASASFHFLSVLLVHGHFELRYGQQSIYLCLLACAISFWRLLLPARNGAMGTSSPACSVQTSAVESECR